MNMNNFENKSRSGNTCCCVVSCHNTYSKTDKSIKFYSFPSKPHLLERRQKWIQAVNRINSDGTPWRPTNNSRICSFHFIGGNKSEDPRHPAYHPTIFKRKEPSSINLGHFNRWKKRKLLTREVTSTDNGQQEPENNLCEDIQLTNINKPLHKSMQVVSLKHIHDNFIFSCDFDRESNNVSTQATIPSSTNNLNIPIFDPISNEISDNSIGSIKHEIIFEQEKYADIGDNNRYIKLEKELTTELIIKNEIFDESDLMNNGQIKHEVLEDSFDQFKKEIAGSSSFSIEHEQIHENEEYLSL